MALSSPQGAVMELVDQVTEAKQSGWLLVAGTSSEELQRELEAKVASQVKAAQFSYDDVRYLARMPLRAIDGRLDTSPRTLDALRRLCQVWDVDIRTKEITSHRKLLGPVIVSVKKIVYPMLRVFLKDFVRQQRAFNALVVELLSELGKRTDPKD